MKSRLNSPHIHRRDFVKTVTGLIGALMGVVIGLPAIGFLISPALRIDKSDVWIPLGPLEKFPIGIPTPIQFNRTQVNGWEKAVFSYGVFVIRKDETKVKVLSNICTHLGCHVTWHPDIKEYVSPCHDGHFDIDGNVTKGPPPRPLDVYATRVENGQLFIHLSKG